MLDDMRMRKLSPKTQSHYVRAVRQFTSYLGRSPDSASAEELRAYQLQLVDQGTSRVLPNAAISPVRRPGRRASPRRAMPWQQPRTLTNDEVYAPTAYILALNKLFGEGDTMNAETLPKVRMPNRDGFIVRFPERL